MILQVGDKTNMLPSEYKANSENNKLPTEAIVAYIHPFGRFYDVLFKFQKEGYRESFQMKESDKADMLAAGLIAPDPAHEATMRMTASFSGF